MRPQYQVSSQPAGILGRLRAGRLPALLICAVIAAPAFALGEDATQVVGKWPQWRGPLANGVAPHGNPPMNWSEDHNVRWKTSIPGLGSGTPVVWGDRVFVTTAVKTDRMAEKPPAADDSARTTPPKHIYQFVLLCLNRETGEVIWRRIARENVPREGLHSTNSYASASPITDGERVWCFFGSQGIYCFDRQGSLLWDRDLGEMRTRRGWGEGATPALHNNVLVVPWDHEDASFVVALDALAGSELWSQQRDEPSGWATPLVIPRGTGQQAVLNGTNRVRSYDLQTGELLWECGGQTVNAIPSPVADRRFVYVMSGYRGSHAVAVPVDADGDVTGSDTLRWTRSRGTPYVPSPLLLEDRLYYTAVNNSVLTCVDVETGELVYGPERLPGIANLYASPVAANERIYLTSREGATAVIAAGDRFEVLATNQLDDGFDASPAIVGTQMFLRGREHVYCLEEADHN